jgi:hypothetical protein
VTSECLSRAVLLPSRDRSQDVYLIELTCDLTQNENLQW